MTPEMAAREKIDAMLVACGWGVQDYAQVDLSAGVGVALREVPLAHGRCDHLLIVDRVPVTDITADSFKRCQVLHQRAPAKQTARKYRAKGHLRRRSISFATPPRHSATGRRRSAAGRG